MVNHSTITFLMFAGGAALVFAAVSAAECFCIGAAEYKGLCVTGLGLMAGSWISAMTGDE